MQDFVNNARGILFLISMFAPFTLILMIPIIKYPKNYAEKEYAARVVLYNIAIWLVWAIYAVAYYSMYMFGLRWMY